MSQLSEVEFQALLKLVVCPDDRQPLTAAPLALIERLNELVAQRALRNVVGSLIDEPLEQALVRQDRQRLYANRAGIPVLLPQEGVLLDDGDRALLPERG